MKRNEIAQYLLQKSKKKQDDIQKICRRRNDNIPYWNGKAGQMKACYRGYAIRCINRKSQESAKQTGKMIKCDKNTKKWGDKAEKVRKVEKQKERAKKNLQSVGAVTGIHL